MAMYGGQFDGVAAFSGGGFMPSQTTQAADNSSFSPAKNREAQALLPVTVKQIISALGSNDDKVNVLIDGVDVTNVTLLGKVLNKAERVSDVTFSLDDGTGRIDCHRWINESLDTNEMEGILDGMYVRVHGHIKNFQGKRQLNVFSIRPVVDFNEVTHHFIECIFVHVHNTKTQKSQGGTGTGTGTSMQSQMSGQPSYPQNQPILDGFTPQAKMVLQCLQRPEFCSTDRGAHINEVSRLLNLPVEKIGEAISYLVDEGYVYNTIDASHFKSTLNA